MITNKHAMYEEAFQDGYWRGYENAMFAVKERSIKYKLYKFFKSILRFK